MVAAALVAAACGSTDATPQAAPTSQAGAQATPDQSQAADQAPVDGQSQVVGNRGDGSEGHTPTGFAGTGTGLFVGDNLNPGFPDGVGVQTFLWFDFTAVDNVTRAVVRSDALTIQGDAFESLGNLLIEPVSYETFGPDLWDSNATGDAVTCELDGATVTCDVTDALGDLGSEGRAQFRIRFENEADNDGQQDLASFFLTDSNTNEPGIFTLEIESE